MPVCHSLKLLGLVRGAKVALPGMANGELVEAQHVHHAHLGQGSANGGGHMQTQKPNSMSKRGERARTQRGARSPCPCAGAPMPVPASKLRVWAKAA